jgi:methylglutaconyl-CoA hydratase
MTRRFETILLKQTGAHATVWLNRPEKRNALNDRLVGELKTVFSQLETDSSVKIVSLKGKGKAFCSGADLEHLKAMRAFDKTKNYEDSLSLAQLYSRIYNFPKPVIAVVEGAALAGGSGLTTVCDFVYAAPDAKFGYPEVKIGFVAALVSAFLIRQVGQRRAKELLLSGEIISAQRACELGMITQVFEAQDIQKAEQDLVHNLLSNSSLAMYTTKLLFNRDIDRELENLAHINADFRSTDDFIEGISSFIEKRKPKWTLHS